MGETKEERKGRVTKADVQQRDEQILSLREEVSHLKAEVSNRGLLLADQELALLNLGSDLRESYQKILELGTAAQSQLDAEAEVSEVIETELATTVEGLFARLVFATQTLGAVATYSGDNAGTARELAGVAAADLIIFVHEGVASGDYTANGALAVAANSAGLVYVEPETCDCGDNS